MKLSKDNPIKVEWQTAAPPDPHQNSVMDDFLMDSLPAAATRIGNMAKKSNSHLGNRNGNGYATGHYGIAWGRKVGMRTDVVSKQHNGSTFW